MDDRHVPRLADRPPRGFHSHRGRPAATNRPGRCCNPKMTISAAMNTRKHLSRATFRAAFTLVEVMIAVMIVGLLTMIAV
ncbi:MAG: prepilin-type N-terminal cleavage/methylation domain-containing protein, partial [Verrucomicrobiota bacterium]